MHESISVKATVIVSVYKDAEALRCVLYGLERQTEKNFEVIVAEDGDDPYISKTCRSPWKLDLSHQTQADLGFRKTRAVNRAIAKAHSPYIAFLDGDCVPHQSWLEQHLQMMSPGHVLVGRRMHLGPYFSRRLRTIPRWINRLESPLHSWLLLPALQLDGARNVELMHPSRFMQRHFGRKRLNLVGCNFSSFKSDLLKVNGYDEELTGVGGEDDDLHWRLEASGVLTINVKFQAVVYHLFHESRRADVTENLRKSHENLAAGRYFARQGVVKSPE